MPGMCDTFLDGLTKGGDKGEHRERPSCRSYRTCNDEAVFLHSSALALQ